MAVAAAVVVAIAAVVGAAVAVRQGNAAKAATRYNVKVNEQNSLIAKQEAADLATQHDKETYMRLGAIRAAQGKSGADSGAGSVLDVIGQVAAESELERQYIVYRGALGERQFVNTARLDQISGDQAATSGYMKAGQELLAGSGASYKAYDNLSRD